MTALYKDVYSDEWKKATIKSATEFLAKALEIGGMGGKLVEKAYMHSGKSKLENKF